MKKRNWIIGGIIVVGILAAIGGNEEDTTKELPKSEQKIEAVAPAPVKAEPSNVVSMTKYGAQMAPIADDITTILTGITDLANMAAADPMIMFEPEYLETVKTVSTAITGVTARIRAVDTYGNAKVEEAHSHMLSAADDLDYIAVNYPLAIENLDADEIGVLSSKIANVGNYAQQTTAVVSSVLD